MRTASFFALALCAGSIAAADPIPNVTAKATSQQVEKLFGPQNLCTDTGLTDSGKGDGSRKFTTNGYAGGGCMWHSGYLPFGGDENPIVEFDFGQVRTVARFHVWNHNGSPSRGFKHVSMMASDDGKTWQAIPQQFQFAKAPKSDDYLGEAYAFRSPVKARYLRFHCESTHRSGGNRELAGLGKVRFYEAEAGVKPNPEQPGAGIVPDGAGVINVKLPPYSAKGDGQADDTAAIQKAIDDWQGTHRTILLPAGTYLLSASLRYTPAKGHGYNTLRGAGTAKTILKLKDNTFTDSAKPQPVLTLGFNGQPNGKGVHADWFNNNVHDFSIDAGRGNPGAIGLQYYSNNVGVLRDVRITSPDARGFIGLDLGYADQNGPCLIKNIDIDGFATGVRSAATVNSQTAENIAVSRCSKVGWENGGQCVSIRRLRVSGTGAGFINQFGVVCLIDSEFTGEGTQELAAISNGETLFARDIQTKGYKLAIENRRQKDQPTPSATGPKVEEWVSTPPLTLFPTEKPRSLNLPIRETPELPLEDPAKWANVRAFRDLADPDDAASVQRAIDSGASTIYFPSGGSYILGKPVELRGKVQRIVGFHANIQGAKGNAIWRTTAETAPVLIVQDVRGHVEVEFKTRGQLVVQNGQGVGGVLDGEGEVYLENVVADWSFAKGRAWARQFNNERPGTHIPNAGATLWILGLKTERGGTLIDTTAGGSTELLGGLCYTTNKGKLAPMFTSTDSRVSFVMGEVCYSGEPYTRIVSETRGGETKILERNGVPLRPAFLNGSQVPLFVGTK